MGINYLLGDTPDSAKPTRVYPSSTPTSDSDFLTGINRGIRQTAALGYAGSAIVGGGLRAIGLESAGASLEKFGIEGYHDYMESAQDYKASVSWTDVWNSDGSFLDWAQGVLGEQLPNMALMIGSGGLGAALGKKIVSKYALEKMASSELMEAAIKKGVTWGAGTGVFAASEILNTGEIYGSILEETGQARPGESLLFGTVAASLDAFTPVRILKGWGYGADFTGFLSKTIASQPLYGRALAAGIGGMIREGTTEGMQALIEAMAVNFVKQTPMLDFSDDQWTEFKESIAAGALMGGVSVVSPTPGVLQATDDEADLTGGEAPPSEEWSIERTNEILNNSDPEAGTKALEELGLFRDIGLGETNVIGRVSGKDIIPTPDFDSIGDVIPAKRTLPKTEPATKTTPLQFSPVSQEGALAKDLVGHLLSANELESNTLQEMNAPVMDAMKASDIRLTPKGRLDVPLKDKYPAIPEYYDRMPNEDRIPIINMLLREEGEKLKTSFKTPAHLQGLPTEEKIAKTKKEFELALLKRVDKRLAAAVGKTSPVQETLLDAIKTSRPTTVLRGPVVREFSEPIKRTLKKSQKKKLKKSQETSVVTPTPSVPLTTMGEGRAPVNLIGQESRPGVKVKGEVVPEIKRTTTKTFFNAMTGKLETVEGKQTPDLSQQDEYNKLNTAYKFVDKLDRDLKSIIGRTGSKRPDTVSVDKDGNPITVPLQTTDDDFKTFTPEEDAETVRQVWRDTLDILVSSGHMTKEEVGDMKLDPTVFTSDFYDINKPVDFQARPPQERVRLQKTGEALETMRRNILLGVRSVGLGWRTVEVRPGESKQTVDSVLSKNERFYVDGKIKQEFELVTADNTDPFSDVRVVRKKDQAVMAIVPWEDARIYRSYHRTFENKNFIVMREALGRGDEPWVVLDKRRDNAVVEKLYPYTEEEWLFLRKTGILDDVYKGRGLPKHSRQREPVFALLEAYSDIEGEKIPPKMGSKSRRELLKSRLTITARLKSMLNDAVQRVIADPDFIYTGDESMPTKDRIAIFNDYLDNAADEIYTEGMLRLVNHEMEIQPKKFLNLFEDLFRFKDSLDTVLTAANRSDGGTKWQFMDSVPSSIAGVVDSVTNDIIIEPSNTIPLPGDTVLMFVAGVDGKYYPQTQTYKALRTEELIRDGKRIGYTMYYETSGGVEKKWMFNPDSPHGSKVRVVRNAPKPRERTKASTPIMDDNEFVYKIENDEEFYDELVFGRTVKFDTLGRPNRGKPVFGHTKRSWEERRRELLDKRILRNQRGILIQVKAGVTPNELAIIDYENQRTGAWRDSSRVQEFRYKAFGVAAGDPYILESFIVREYVPTGIRKPKESVGLTRTKKKPGLGTANAHRKAVLQKRRDHEARLDALDSTSLTDKDVSLNDLIVIKPSALYKHDGMYLIPYRVLDKTKVGALLENGRLIPFKDIGSSQPMERDATNIFVKRDNQFVTKENAAFRYISDNILMNDMGVYIRDPVDGEDHRTVIIADREVTKDINSKYLSKLSKIEAASRSLEEKKKEVRNSKARRKRAFLNGEINESERAIGDEIDNVSIKEAKENLDNAQMRANFFHREETPYILSSAILDKRATQVGVITDSQQIEQWADPDLYNMGLIEIIGSMGDSAMRIHQRARYAEQIAVLREDIAAIKKRKPDARTELNFEESESTPLLLGFQRAELIEGYEEEIAFLSEEIRNLEKSENLHKITPEEIVEFKLKKTAAQLVGMTGARITLNTLDGNKVKGTIKRLIIDRDGKGVEITTPVDVKRVHFDNIASFKAAHTFSGAAPVELKSPQERLDAVFKREASYQESVNLNRKPSENVQVLLRKHYGYFDHDGYRVPATKLHTATGLKSTDFFNSYDERLKKFPKDKLLLVTMSNGSKFLGTVDRVDNPMDGDEVWMSGIFTRAPGESFNQRKLKSLNKRDRRKGAPQIKKFDANKIIFIERNHGLSLPSTEKPIAVAKRTDEPNVDATPRRQLGFSFSPPTDLAAKAKDFYTKTRPTNRKEEVMNYENALPIISDSAVYEVYDLDGNGKDVPTGTFTPVYFGMDGRVFKVEGKERLTRKQAGYERRKVMKAVPKAQEEARLKKEREASLKEAFEKKKEAKKEKRTLVRNRVGTGEVSSEPIQGFKPIKPDRGEITLIVSRILNKKGLASVVPSGQIKRGVTQKKAFALVETAVGRKLTEKFFVFVGDPQNLPVQNSPEGMTTRALTYGNKIYIAENSIAPGEMRGIVFHELGVHIGMRLGMSMEQMTNILDTFRKLALHNKDIQASVEFASLAVPEGVMNRDDVVIEEALAYYIQNFPPKALPNTLWKKLIAIGKEIFSGIQLRRGKATINDIVNLIQGATRNLEDMQLRTVDSLNDWAIEQPMASAVETSIGQWRNPQEIDAGPVMNWINKKMKFMHTYGELTDFHQFVSLHNEILGNTTMVERSARSFFDGLKNAPKEVSREMFEYLIDAAGDPLSISDPHFREIAVDAKKVIMEIGRKLVESGHINKQEYEKLKGAYLPRVYLKYMLEKKPYKAKGGGLGVSKLSYTKPRLDIPEDVREAYYNEVKDASYLVARAISIPLRDLAIFQGLKEMVTKKEWVLPNQLASWDGLEVTVHWLEREAAAIYARMNYIPVEQKVAAREYADRMMAVAEEQKEKFAPDENLAKDWVELRKDERLGALSGLVVRKEIADQFNVVEFMIGDPGWAERWLGDDGYATRATMLWKWAHVVINPATVIRNHISNMSLMYLSGMSMRNVVSYMARAFDELAKDNSNPMVSKVGEGSEWVRRFERMGIRKGTWSNVELMRMDDEFQAVLAKATKEGDAGSLFKILAFAKDKFHLVHNKSGNFYQFLEEWAKLAKAMHEVEVNGMADVDAANQAQKWLIDYSFVGKSVRFLRSSPIGVPFLTFTTKVIPLMMEVATRSPQRFIPFIAMYYAMEAVTKSMLDLDDDEYEMYMNRLPEYVREGHGIIPVPMEDEEGNPYFMNLKHHMPWQVLQDIGYGLYKGDIFGAAKGFGVFGSPLISLAAGAVTNVDPFTEREITDPGDSAPDRAWDWVKWVYNLTLPPFMTSYGAFGEAYDYVTQTKDRYGEKKSLPNVLGKATGFNMISASEGEREGNLNYLGWKLREMEMARSRALKEAHTSEEKRELRDSYGKRIKEQKEKIREYSRLTS